ncbi:MAG TPA: enoyl-CoA hydratase/isomerase family protein, partial [Thermomicrobiales bacterium]|nr:enoyl-CoA hydratase/isomerase family protein [Thermomicrobiales bacterium]
MGNYETQLYAKDGAVARITFNRPERRNATDVKFYEDFIACLEEAEADPEVRSIVLAGAGTVFSAGQDLKWSATCTEADFDEYNRLINIAWNKIRKLSKPVIARVHGDALGGGMYMSTRCDLIAMKSTARMAMREIVTGEQSGGTHLLT